MRTVDKATLKYLSKDRIAEYLIKIRRQKANLVNFSDERLLETQGIVKNGLLTITGLMLFSECPQEFFPQLSVTAMAVQGREIGE